jgi:hypothetical protein
MTLAEARNAFAIRYYQWSAGIFQRELQLGFPLLASMRSRSAAKCLSFLQALSSAERADAAGALVKRSHAWALSLLGEEISQREQELSEQWRAYRPEHALTRRQGFNARRCAIVVKRELSGVTGSFESMSGSVGRYSQRVNGWQVQTMVGFGSPPHYAHSIFGGATALESGISILKCLGLSSQTAWDAVQAGDEESTARSLVLAASCFLEAAPSLLAGLDHQEAELQMPTADVQPRPLPKLGKKAT